MNHWKFQFNINWTNEGVRLLESKLHQSYSFSDTFLFVLVLFFPPRDVLTCSPLSLTDQVLLNEFWLNSYTMTQATWFCLQDSSSWENLETKSLAQILKNQVKFISNLFDSNPSLGIL